MYASSVRAGLAKLFTKARLFSRGCRKERNMSHVPRILPTSSWLQLVEARGRASEENNLAACGPCVETVVQTVVQTVVKTVQTVETATEDALT